jgi:mannose-6-phosphate isomerase-like protein (cupin superfamily)
MKPTKYTAKDANKIDLGTKVIYKYPMPTKLFDNGRMVVKGRHPEDPSKFAFESECNFIIFVTKGAGKVVAGNHEFDLEVDDVVFVPAKSKFDAEGDIEYITFDAPAFFPEQSSEITA